MKIGERIKYLRNKAGLTQADMAKILDISLSSYIKYERGERSPNSNILVCLASQFDTSVDFILGYSEEENSYKEQIESSYKQLFEEDFEKTFGSDAKNIQDMISAIMNIIDMVIYFPELVDVIYVLSELKNKLFRIHSTCSYLFCYEKHAMEDERYKECVDPPTTQDLVEMFDLVANTKEMLDDYLHKLIKKEYYQYPRQPVYSNEIKDYIKKQQRSTLNDYHIYKTRTGHWFSIDPQNPHAKNK